MATHDFDIGQKIGEHENAIKSLKESHLLHHQRIEKVEIWQSEEQKSRDKRRAQIAVIKVSIGVGILILASMSYIALSIVSPSDMKVMQPQFVGLIKWLVSFSR